MAISHSGAMAQAPQRRASTSGGLFLEVSAPEGPSPWALLLRAALPAFSRLTEHSEARKIVTPPPPPLPRCFWEMLSGMSGLWEAIAEEDDGLRFRHFLTVKGRSSARTPVQIGVQVEIVQRTSHLHRAGSLPRELEAVVFRTFLVLGQGRDAAGLHEAGPLQHGPPHTATHFGSEQCSATTLSRALSFQDI